MSTDGRGLGAAFAWMIALTSCAGGARSAPPSEAPITIVVARSLREAAAAPPTDGPAAAPSASEAPASAVATESPPLVATPERGPRLCGCALCEPVLSGDACSADADCAPATPCHAERCVAKSRAAPRDPHASCTRSLACGSADVNACGCLHGTCALYPPPPSR